MKRLPVHMLDPGSATDGQGPVYDVALGRVVWADPPAGGSGTGVVETIVPGTGIAVDSTDPANPVVSATGSGGGGTVQDTTVSRALTAQTPATGAWTDVIWDTEENDPLGAWSSGAASSIVVPSGITRARLTAAVAWSNSGSGSRYLRLYNATTDATYGGDIRGAVNEALTTVGTPWVPVAAGNSLRLRVLTNAGASIQGTGFGGPTRLTVEWA